MKMIRLLSLLILITVLSQCGSGRNLTALDEGQKEIFIAALGSTGRAYSITNPLTSLAAKKAFFGHGAVQSDQNLNKMKLLIGAALESGDCTREQNKKNEEGKINIRSSLTGENCPILAKLQWEGTFDRVSRNGSAKYLFEYEAKMNEIKKINDIDRAQLEGNFWIFSVTSDNLSRGEGRVDISGELNSQVHGKIGLYTAGYLNYEFDSNLKTGTTLAELKFGLELPKFTGEVRITYSLAGKKVESHYYLNNVELTKEEFKALFSALSSSGFSEGDVLEIPQ